MRVRNRGRLFGASVVDLHDAMPELVVQSRKECADAIVYVEVGFGLCPVPEDLELVRKCARF